MATRATPNLDLCLSTEFGRAYLDGIFTALLLMYGSPPVGRRHTTGEYMCFVAVLDRIMGVIVPVDETQQWWRLYREWYAASIQEVKKGGDS